MSRHTCLSIVGLSVALVCSTVSGQFLDSYEFRKPTGPERAAFFLKKAPKPPELDGKLGEAFWAGAVVSKQFGVGAVKNPLNNTVLMAAFDDAHLYLATRCEVADPAKLKKLITLTMDETAKVWGDDCIDFKFSPDKGTTVFQFIANVNGAGYDSRDSDARWNSGWKRAAAVAEGAYLVEMAIPLKDLDIPALTPGRSLLHVFGRTDRTQTPTELSTAFREPYGNIDKGVAVVLGTKEQYEALQGAGAFTRETRIDLYLDRDQYPVLQNLGTGRIKMTSSQTGEKVEGEVRLELSLWQEEELVELQTIKPVASSVLDFDWRVAGRKPGTYELRARLSDAKGPFATTKREIILQKAKAPRSGRIEISVTPAPAGFSSWPVTFGVPFPRGALDSVEHVRLADESGAELPIQVKVTGLWSKKGSIRWLLIDAAPPVKTAGQTLFLEYGPRVGRSEVVSPVRVVETDEAIAVSTGPLKFSVLKKDTPGISSVWRDTDRDGQFSETEQVLRDDAARGPYLVDEPGTVFWASKDADAEVVVEESGPIKACVRVSGWHVSETGAKLGKFILRYYAYRGLPYIRVFHTFIITADTDQVHYQNIGYTIPFGSRTFCFGTPYVSSGTFDSRTIKLGGAHLLQRDDLCYKVHEHGQFKEEGEKSEGWVTAGHPGRFLTLCVKDFWQQFPKELEVLTDQVNVHFWPRHSETPIRTGENLSIRNVYQQWFAHEGPILNFKVPEEVLPFVKQDSEKYNYPSAKVANAIGLAKSHEMLLYFHPDDWERAESRNVNRVFQDAPAAVVDPDWFCATEVFGTMFPKTDGKYPRIERAIDETIACIMRHRLMDRDYGMFNYGDSHHNWDWQNRRWNLHRIWRNTHHGWTRWPWLMFARTGRKDLLDWAESNARHVADVDHCHFAPKEFVGIGYPREKLVGGICDYKGFVHWASGGRLCYNSAADAMIWHYYLTGNQRSLTAALEHGVALVADGRALPHREGSGRATSACALYHLTWDNDYLEFLERTMDTLLNSQREDGSFPQWENFAPSFQRYIDLTRSRRATQAMARWGDWIAGQPNPPCGYHGKINILAHAYLYTGDERYLVPAAYAVSSFVDYLYEGSDPRYRGMSVSHPNNLDQSYFMQEVPYYLRAVEEHGGEMEKNRPTRTLIRALSREMVDGKQKYVFHAYLQQGADKPLGLDIPVRGYEKVEYAAVLTGQSGKEARAEGRPEPLKTHTSLKVRVPKDGDTSYHLRVMADKNFFVSVPLTGALPGLKEVYPIFPEGITVGGGFRYYFNVPPGAVTFAMVYKGRAWPLQYEIFGPKGEVAAKDVWIGSNDLIIPERRTEVTVGEKERTGWSFSVVGYGQARLLRFEASPADGERAFTFAVAREKLFELE